MHNYIDDVWVIVNNFSPFALIPAKNFWNQRDWNKMLETGKFNNISNSFIQQEWILLDFQTSLLKKDILLPEPSIFLNQEEKYPESKS